MRESESERVRVRVRVRVRDNAVRHIVQRAKDKHAKRHKQILIKFCATLNNKYFYYIRVITYS